MKANDWRELKLLARMDARKRIERRSICDGKERFASYSEATRVIRAHIHGRVAYHCHRCNGFHVGSVDRGKRLAHNKIREEGRRV